MDLEGNFDLEEELLAIDFDSIVELKPLQDEVAEQRRQNLEASLMKREQSVAEKHLMMADFVGADRRV